MDHHLLVVANNDDGGGGGDYGDDDDDDGGTTTTTQQQRKCTRVFTNPRYSGQLIWHDSQRITTPLDILSALARAHPTRECIGERLFTADADADATTSASDAASSASPHGPFVFHTYGMLLQRSERMAVALTHLDLLPGDRIGYYAPNRMEYHVLLMACALQRFVLVSIYDTLGPHAALYIVQHAQPRAVFGDFSKLDKLSIIIEEVKSRYHNHAVEEASGDDFSYLQNIIVFDSRAHENALIEEKIRESSGRKLPFTKRLSEIEDAEEKSEISSDTLVHEFDPAQPEDVALLMYTSGTTGAPKGIQLTHQNIMSAVTGLHQKLPEWAFKKYEQHFFLSYLPLAHIFGLVCDLTIMRIGGSIGIYSGHPKWLIEDIQALRPTVFAGVPRVYQKVYAGIMTRVDASNWAKRAMFRLGYNWKRIWCHHNFGSFSADALVFSSIKEKFGGRIICMVSAGAPMPAHLAEFFRVCVCDVFLEGYGLTETSGMGMAMEDDKKLNYGNCGTPYCCVELKLADVTEMGYSVDDDPPRGEILCRGPCVFSSYYRDQELTAASFEDGWFLTGDIGCALPGSKFKVIDRKKNLFKLSQGEYISSEKVEGLICSSNYVDECFVYGDSEKDYLVAVVVPSFEILQDVVASSVEGERINHETVCASQVANKVVLDDIEAVCRERGCVGFEIPKRVHLHDLSFDIQRDLVTPSLKFKRHNMKEYFAREIEQMYK